MLADSPLRDIIASALAPLGYGVVRVLISGGAHPVLQVMIERQDGAAVSLDDCVCATQTVSTVLDIEDPLPGAWTLEVSSPGIDRPLVSPQDFQRFAGARVRIDLTLPIDGKHRFIGQLLGVVDGCAHLQIEHRGEPVEIALPFDHMRAARLSPVLSTAGAPRSAKSTARRAPPATRARRVER